MKHTPPHDSARVSPGWIGVDLDGTLAHYTGWSGPDQIGAPIPRMVDFVKDLLVRGWEIRIFTARVGPQKQPQDRVHAAQAIRAWCMRHLGQEVPITHEKDLSMLWCYDDRCTQVLYNTGVLVENKALPAPAFDPSI